MILHEGRTVDGASPKLDGTCALGLDVFAGFGPVVQEGQWSLLLVQE